MKITDLLIGVVGFAILGGGLLYVKKRHENDPVIVRPKGVPADASYYGETQEWARCLNTSDGQALDCEIYSANGELVYKGVRPKPTAM